LRDKRNDGAAAARKGVLDCPRRVVRSGKRDALNARVLDERFAELATSRHEMQSLARHTSLVQQLDHEEARDRRLIGRLGNDRISGSERGGDLTRENGDGKVPRRNTRERTAP